MKCLVCYFSGSGNTKLACDYIAGKIDTVEFDFYSIRSDEKVDCEKYDVIGFAAFADFWGPSPKMISFINSLPNGSGKPAFVFNTFGMMNGGTLRAVHSLVAKKGFNIIAGHALHMPENMPNMIIAGMANEQAPDAEELSAFDDFIKGLAACLSGPEALGKAKRFRLPLRDRFFPSMPRFFGKSQMGPKFVDTALCTKCRTCVNVCPYGAVSMGAFPQFDEKKCLTCWACYIHCPTLAIYTKKFRGKGHRPAPIAAVREKLRIVK